MRIDIEVEGKRVFTEALHQGRSWSWSPGEGVIEGSEQGAAALRHGSGFPFKLFGLHEMQRRGHRLELAGREAIGGIDYLVLDPATWLIDRERTRRAAPRPARGRRRYPTSSIFA